MASKKTTPKTTTTKGAPVTPHPVLARLPFTAPNRALMEGWEPESDRQREALGVVRDTLRGHAALLAGYPSPVGADHLAIARPAGLRLWLVDLTPERCWEGRLVTPAVVAIAWWRGLRHEERSTLAAFFGASATPTPATLPGMAAG